MSEEDFKHLIAWLDNEGRERSELAFTAGPARQIADRFQAIFDELDDIASSRDYTPDWGDDDDV
jgi:hypothetical protein